MLHEATRPEALERSTTKAAMRPQPPTPELASKGFNTLNTYAPKPLNP